MTRRDDPHVLTAGSPEDLGQVGHRRPPISRRHLLVAGAVGLALGAGATEGANLAGSDLGRSGPSTTASAPPPGETLMYEHGVLKRVLLVYQEAVGRAGDDPTLAADAIHAGATIIHNFIEDFHEALEEGYIFPALVDAGREVATVDTLLLQHARGRLITQLLLADATPHTVAATSGRQRVLAATRAFVRMYQPHEAREDTVIFPTFRAMHSSEQLDDYGAMFDRLQDQQLGPNGFASAVDHVADIESRLGIDDLAQFTPAAIAPTAAT